MALCKEKEAMRRCPRCGGSALIDYDEWLCLNCGYREDVLPRPNNRGDGEGKHYKAKSKEARKDTIIVR